jgi:hypothetical protein
MRHDAAAELLQTTLVVAGLGAFQRSLKPFVAVGLEEIVHPADC